MASFFSSSSLLSTPTRQAGAAEAGTLDAFCGRPCPPQLLHESAEEILYIPRNRADFTGRPAKQGRANPHSLPSPPLPALPGHLEISNLTFLPGSKQSTFSRVLWYEEPVAERTGEVLATAGGFVGVRPPSRVCNAYFQHRWRAGRKEGKPDVEFGQCALQRLLIAGAHRKTLERQRK